MNPADLMLAQHYYIKDSKENFWTDTFYLHTAKEVAEGLYRTACLAPHDDLLYSGIVFFTVIDVDGYVVHITDDVK